MTVHSPIDPLESALADLASRVDITDVDAFTAATMVKVRRGRDDARRRRTFSVVRGSNARQVLAVAAAILLVVTAVLAVPRSRDAIADLLGIDGLRIRSGDVPATSSPGSSAVTSSSTFSPTGSSTVSSTTGPTVSGAAPFDAAAVGRDLALGSEVSLATARATLPALRELDSAYGPPDAMYRSDRPAGLVSFVWRARQGLAGSPTAPTVGLVVQQYPGSGDVSYFLKTLSPGSRAREVTVEGKKGYWVDGAPHSIAYVDARNAFVEDTVRWASNALVWAANGVTHRIESSLTQDEAVALVALLK
ncbi:MAG TPA: hypothetical protein VM282_09045 [Acidimicrobiales bacterium]|nr:hypothetical protein [Acidimicrobiales bacterium]